MLFDARDGRLLRLQDPVAVAAFIPDGRGFITGNDFASHDRSRTSATLTSWDLRFLLEGREERIPNKIPSVDELRLPTVVETPLDGPKVGPILFSRFTG